MLERLHTCLMRKIPRFNSWFRYVLIKTSPILGEVGNGLVARVCNSDGLEYQSFKLGVVCSNRTIPTNPYREIYEKGCENHIKQITKDEAKYLASKGFKFHSDIFKSHSRNPHYYCKESPAVLKVLEKYRRGQLAQGGK